MKRGRITGWDILLEESSFILGVDLDKLSERFILDQRIVRAGNGFRRGVRQGRQESSRKHHQSLGLLVLQLLGSTPFAPLPPSTRKFTR